MEEAETYIFPHLLLSYNGLSPKLKRCFSYCAVFSKDTHINIESLIKDWMALGYLGSNVGDMELKGRECFDALAMRSLFQDFDKGDSNEILYCKMHDIVHDFAQFIKRNCRVEAREIKKSTTCRVCDPSRVFKVDEFCTLGCYEEPLPNICDCLVRMRVFKFGKCKRIPQGMETLIHLRKLIMIHITKLSCNDLKAIFKFYHLESLYLSECNIEEIPKKVGNLIQLRHFALSWNKSLKELPKEIGNLIQLRDLDLKGNESLKELPTEIGNSIHLRYLTIIGNTSLKGLPESLCNLQELQTLDNEEGCDNLCRIPERLLPKLSEFPREIGESKLELLKNLKHTNGILSLRIRLNSDSDLNEVVEGAQKAELMNELHIKRLKIKFVEKEVPSSSSWVLNMDAMDALEPHPKPE